MRSKTTVQDIQDLKVLIVDDNQQILDLLKAVLESFGILYVYSANGGHDAFKTFRTKKIDLVITDLVMPEGDGIEFVRNIRNHQKSPNQYLPIIMLSGNCDKSKVLQARDAGITEVLRKPFNARELYKRIENMVENPKKFIRSENFFGPDRRREKTKEPYSGPYRRKSDPKNLKEDMGEIAYIDRSQNVKGVIIDLV